MTTSKIILHGSVHDGNELTTEASLEHFRELPDDLYIRMQGVYFKCVDVEGNDFHFEVIPPDEIHDCYSDRQ